MITFFALINIFPVNTIDVNRLRVTVTVPRYDLDLRHLSLKTFPTIRTHMMNIGDKFH